MTDDSGIRHQYFEEGVASPADKMLAKAIKDAKVPATCLLGGYMVKAEVMLGNAPCASCSGPREKCGGRAKVIADRPREVTRDQPMYPGNMIERATNTTPEVRREQRRAIIFGLNRIAKDAESERMQRAENQEEETEK